jgi:hypothetical protein
MMFIYNTDPVSWLLWFLSLGLGLYCLYPSKSTGGGIRYLSPKIAFGFAFMLFHVLRPLYLMLTGDYYGSIFHFYYFSSSLEFNMMSLASLIAGIAFLLGWNWITKRESGIISKPLEPAGNPSSSHFGRRVVLLIPVALLGVYFGLQQNISTGVVSFRFLVRSSLIALTFLSILGGIYTKKKLEKILFWGMALVSAFIYLGLFLRDYGGSRLFLFFFILPGFAILLMVFRRWGELLTAALTLFFVVVFMFLGNIRYDISTAQSGVLSQVNSKFSTNFADVASYILRSGDFEAFEKGMLVMDVFPNHTPPLYGASFASVLIMPIPRAIWPEKPDISPNTALVQAYPNMPINFAITLVGEAYANLLWPGVFIIFLLFGLVSAKIYVHALSVNSPEMWVRIGLYMAYVILVMRGSFHSMTSYYLFVLLWFVISEWLGGFGRSYAINRRDLWKEK